jgi:hypothetical protein
MHQGRLPMMTDKEIKQKGINILSQCLGDVGAERFIALIQRGRFDYTEWKQGLDEELTLEEISHNAMLLRQQSKV